MTLNVVMALILRYFTELSSFSAVGLKTADYRRLPQTTADYRRLFSRYYYSVDGCITR